MKRILYILIPMAVVAYCTLTGCKKPNDYPSHTVKVSFPIVTLIGPQDTTINRGATWVDPGATWLDTVTGETGTLKATAINTSKDSAYLLVYTATNKNGFQAYVTRGLGVTNYNGPLDISGSYTDSYGGTDSLYKVARALFFHPNIDLTYDASIGYSGDPGVIVIKSDSTISASTVYTLYTGTVGAPIPVTFSGATISYATPITFSYNVNIKNVPQSSATFTHN